MIKNFTCFCAPLSTATRFFSVSRLPQNLMLECRNFSLIAKYLYDDD